LYELVLGTYLLSLNIFSINVLYVFQPSLILEYFNVRMGLRF